MSSRLSFTREAAMGVLSDVVALKKSEAQKVAQSLGPGEEFGGVSFRGLDPLNMSMLRWILLGKPVDGQGVVEDIDLFELLAEGEDGPWVYLIPNDMRDRLAELSQEEDDEVSKAMAAKWCEQEELAGWELDDAVGVLKELGDLADGSRYEDKVLMLWICL
jgi:hypothetical protein